MKFEIKHSWKGSVLFEAELGIEFEKENYPVQLGAAVKLATKVCADLRGADLSGANLALANLSGADLSGANLSGANLSGARLVDADLSGANLSGARLVDANLVDADLVDANLTRADLTRANLTRADLALANLSGAYLVDANLTRADLRGAYLSGADLSGADLSGADLSGADLLGAYLRNTHLAGADLRAFKQDLIAEVLRLPNELEALREAVVGGKIDGSTYSGNGCACLAGTMAIAHGAGSITSGGEVECSGVKFHADASSPRERWFMMIKPGDTPETNQASKFALEWVNEAIAIRDMIRKTV